jgi:long-chain acyl-CoA synthetase
MQGYQGPQDKPVTVNIADADGIAMPDIDVVLMREGKLLARMKPEPMVELRFEYSSHIIILSKNCAWWIVADFAIWISGHVSVPFFPVAKDASLISLFRHSELVACFTGPLDHLLPIGEDVFQRLTYIAFPNIEEAHIPPHSTRWSDIVRDQAPLEGNPVREPDEVATIIYTSGTIGQPKGVMRSFESMSLIGKWMKHCRG